MKRLWMIPLAVFVILLCVFLLKATVTTSASGQGELAQDNTSVIHYTEMDVGGHHYIIFQSNYGRAISAVKVD